MHSLNRKALVLTALTTLASTTAAAGEVSVAVAANFTDAAKEIAAAFEQDSGHTAVLSFGSSGQLYTQITQEAPFEVFLSADQARPRDAENDGFAVPGSRFTYAIGKLVLWSQDAGRTLDQDTLAAGAFEKLAIANPDTAPYGAAAVQVMQKLGVYETLTPKLVKGNSISQTYQFVATGNAELGFIALAQLAGTSEGVQWRVPDELYEPIFQDAVLLKKGADDEAAQAFIAYLKGEKAHAVIEKYGYGIAD